MRFTRLLESVVTLLVRYSESSKVVIVAVQASGGRPEPVALTVDVGETPTLQSVAAAVAEALVSPVDIGRLREEAAYVAVVGLGDSNVGTSTIDPGDLQTVGHVLTSADIVFTAHPAIGELRCTYHEDAFDHRAVARLLEQITLLERAAAASTRQAIADVDLLTAGERDELLALSPASPSEPTSCIHEVFQDQVVMRPTSVAATFENQVTLTYGQLDRLANALAWQLVGEGVGRGDRVGIRVARSPELLIALMGVLKSGAAYVPIDPACPPARQREIAELGSLAAVVVDTRDGPDLGLAHTVIFEAEGPGVDDPPTVQSASTDVAYVLFTSGSTGRPKGVAVRHENVVRLFRTTAPMFDPGPADAWLNAHEYTFDASVWEIFGALLSGGRVVVPARATTRDPDALVQIVSREAVTMLTITPTAFEGFRDVALQRGDDFSMLRFVVLCAEALTFRSLQPWFERWGDEQPQVVNMYGITETTVHSTAYRVRAADVMDPRRKIGRGLPDTPVYVLDQHGRLVPFGMPGEICVGGPGVSSGYLVAATADHERFAPDPYAGQPAATMYRSGDRARWLADGSIEYLGRSDHQVKVRGFRVELGEIERTMLGHPEIVAARAWVIRRPERPPLIAAVYVPPSGRTPPAADVRRFIAARLPEYMVPAGFVSVPELPFTNNGKLDVGRLPDPFDADSGVPGEALNAAEQVVMASVADVLGLSSVGLDGSFFELGGDSITAVRLVARLRRESFFADVALVYEHRSVRALAAALLPGTNAEAPIEPFGLVASVDWPRIPDQAVDAYPATKLQAGMLFHNCLDDRLYNDTLSYRIHHTLDEQAFRVALAGMVAAHPILRTSFLVGSPSGPIQVVHGDAAVSCRFIDGPLPAGEITEQRTRFDWNEPGLISITVHRLPDESVITLSVHHSILDGWSVASLIASLLRAYANVRRGDPADVLPEDPQHWRDFVALELEAISDKNELAFWANYLDGVEPTVLPRVGSTDAPTTDEVVVAVQSPAALAMSNLAIALGTPVKTAYFAVYVALLCTIAAEEEVVTGLVTGCRPEAPGSDEALGLFLNTLPFRCDIAHHTWRSLILAIFSQEGLLYRHRRLPYEQIQVAAGVKRLCATGFNYTDFHVYDELEAIGLSLTDVSYVEKTDLDLLLTVALQPVQKMMTATFNHDPGQLTPGQVQLWAEIYLGLTSRAGARPDEPISVSVEEVLIELGRQSVVRAPTEQNPQSPLPMIVGQANRRVSAIAVSLDREQLTYRELLAQSDAVRHRLREMNITRGQRVACLLRRGIDPLVALIGVWSAGGSYVPIDPSLPRARQQLLAQIAGCEVALQSADCPAEWWTGPSIKMDRLPGPESPNHADRYDLRADDEAYVLFTSGSTGEPKAVSMSHGALSNLVRWQITQPEFADSKPVSQFAALSFDVSIQEMVCAAAAGCTLVVVPDDIKRNPVALLEFLDHHGIAVAYLPVVALRQLAAAWTTFGVAPRCLRCVITAGEALNINDNIRRFCSECNVELINQYGPTETHVVTSHRLDGATPDWPSRPPIGRPIPNVNLAVCDETGRPTPLGTPGELWLGGASLGRGYVTADGRDPRSAGPWTSQGGERFYRTGDRAFIDFDGTVHYVGRCDDQLKIRGHRLEPGEVAAVLMRHRAVKACVVRPHHLGDEAVGVIAYVEANGASVEIAELLDHARAELPEYAVPLSVEVLPKIPLTRSGKVDAKALPAPSAFGAPHQPNVVATPMERRILRVWEHVLEHRVDSPTMSFFDAGGNSLLVLQLYVGLQEELGLAFPMHELFRRPTARSFAALLNRGERASGKERQEQHRAPAGIAEISASRRAARYSSRRQGS